MCDEKPYNFVMDFLVRVICAKGRRNGKGDVLPVAKNNNPLKMIALVSVIGMDLAISVIAGFFGGRYLDGLFGTAPLFLLVGFLVGLAAGIYSIFLLIKPFLGE